jgi:uncharacterized protein YdcH (DUF465 family)
MKGQSQALKDLLLRTDEEFHGLAVKHQELETALHQLAAKSYLSEPEQLEAATLKKRKLQLKDRMEDILRRHQEAGPSPTQATPGSGRSAPGARPQLGR